MIIEEYTREAGVRNLEREIGSLCRKVAREFAEGKAKRKVTVNAKKARQMLGKRRFFSEAKRRTSEPGVATGLAWTPVGGEVLFVEATDYPGNGKLNITGQLGDVMQRVRAGRALIRARATPSSSIPICRTTTSRRHDLHVHVPAGAIPKDGPSAGVAMATALASLISNRPVRDDTAMTGELTLTGQVLPIGGLKEKALAAQDAGHQARDRAAAERAGHRGHPRAPAQGHRVHLRRADRGRARPGAGAGRDRRPTAPAGAGRARAAAGGTARARAPSRTRTASGQASRASAKAARKSAPAGAGVARSAPAPSTLALAPARRAGATRPCCAVRSRRRVLVRAQRARVADRADLGDVAAERQADGPVRDRAHLAHRARDLAHVVGARQPPGREAAELDAADLGDRLVAAEVHELPRLR